MIGTLIRLALKYWKWIAVGLAVLALVVVVKLHFAGDAQARKDRDTYKAAYLDWQRYGLAEQKAFAAQKQARSDEAGQAIDSLKSANLTCEARVTEARRSAQAIRKLVNEPPKLSPAGCPVRGAAALVDPDRLWDAIGAK